MFTEIRKRDGRIASFDEQKITEAIFKAAKAVGGEDRFIAQSLTNQVVNYLVNNNGVMVPSVEEIQDVVEKILIENGHARTAKAYILYRDRRSRMREGKTELMDAVKEILVETSRENANINNSPSAKMLQIAMAASKKYYLTNLLPQEMGEAHEQGYLHIHDLDYYAKTLNCLQIDLKKLFQKGFHTGNGWIRPPQRIYSAAALSAIILQSNQNDMYGGQSFPHFDRDMGDVIRSFKHQPDEEETYQAMEGFIYNLNTMHSLSGRERIWVYDKEKKDFSTRTMEDFNEDFEEGRYQALSLNYDTGKTELKDIKATIKHKNLNKLYTVKLKSGQRVRVTDNHSMMTINEQGEITTAVPSHLERALVPRQLNLEKGELACSVVQQFAAFSGGGYGGDNLVTATSILKERREGVEECRSPGEQTPYDYEFLHPLIKDVYGDHYENAKNSPLKTGHLQDIIEDLASRILEIEEEEFLHNLTRKEFWMYKLVDILPQVKETERYHYREMLSRFFLSETVNDKAGSFIDDNCHSPEDVRGWAKRILQQNKKMVSLQKILSRSLQVWPLRVDQLIDEPHEEYVYDISVADNENFLTAEGIFVHNSRAGAQVPFSSINFGTDISPEGRMVTRALLKAYEGGLGRGENPVFPNLVFRTKEGVNFNPGDPNYDLFQLALQVASHRLNPAFSFMDSSFNKKYGDEVSYMGCRTRTIANRHGPEISASRGNIASVSLNLPRLALLSRGEKGFFEELDKLLNLAVRQLLHRFEILSELTEKDLPFLIGERLYMDSEKLEPCEPIREVIKHGTLSIGFIGLAEALMLLVGSHHGETAEAQGLGLKIVEHMWEKTRQSNDEYDLNFALFATPAEGLSGRFIKIDRNLFGSLPGVTDKDYYTNSYHLPVNYLTSLYQKIKIEGQYHTYCNGGHISYVEIPSPPKNNVEVVEKIVRYMAECNLGYGGINYPIDECNECNFSGIISQSCPQCQGENIRRIRRITGYLSTESRFNSAKKAELRDRRSHINDCW